MLLVLPSELLEQEIVPLLSPLSLLNLLMSSQALHDRIGLTKIISQYNTPQKTLLFTEWAWRNFSTIQLLSLLPKTLPIEQLSVYEEIYLYLRFNSTHEAHEAANLLHRQYVKYNRGNEFFPPFAIPTKVFRYLRTLKKQKEFLPYGNTAANRRFNDALSYFLVKDARHCTSYSYRLKSRALSRYLVNELSPGQIARIFQWSPTYSKKQNFAIIKKQLAGEIVTALVLYSRYKIEVELGEETQAVSCRWLAEIPSEENTRKLSLTIRPQERSLIVESWDSNVNWTIGRLLEPNLIATLRQWRQTDHSVQLLKEATKLFFNERNDTEWITRLNKQLNCYQLSLTIVNKTR